MKATVELDKGVVRWFYRIRASNGRIMTTSQKYFSRSNALRAATAAAKSLGVELKVVKK